MPRLPCPAPPALARRALALALVGTAGCGGKDEETDIELPFCFTFDDADSYELDDLDEPDPASGEIWGRLVTDESDDVDDPSFVAFVEYTLENVDVQGAPQLGETDDEGEFTERVGAGTWLLQLSARQGSYTCANELELVVEPGKLTVACVDVGCEQ